MGKVRREGVNPLFFNTKKNKKTFQKGIDKSLEVWYNIIRKKEREHKVPHHH
jgi:hypothetical protein